MFEATERIGEARQQALRLFAAARRVGYPSFGLVSLLDSEPAELPDALDQTYCLPDTAAAVVAAAHATADLLTAASAGACATLQVEIDTPWAGIARRRRTPPAAAAVERIGTVRVLHGRDDVAANRLDMSRTLRTPLRDASQRAS